MPINLSSADPSRFIKNGFGMVREFVTAGDVKELTSLVESALKCAQDETCERPHNVLVPLRWNDRIVRLLMSSSKVDDRAGLVGASDLKWISGYISIKEAHSPPLWWHQDWWCWDHPVSFVRAPQQIAVLCYPGATTEGNGALRVLPGSHHRSAPIHRILPEAHGQVASEIDASHEVMSDLPGQVTFRVEAGDAVVLDYRLLHGTHGNASAIRRDCVLLSLTPCWGQLPDDIKAHLIRHPAQPSEQERTNAAELPIWLPRYLGVPKDFPLNRNAPAEFWMAD